MGIEFLELQDVLQIHQDQVTRYGGASEIRDVGLLQSALAQPQASFGGKYLHEDIFHMAAAYLFHLCANHPFVDGNKRTAAVAALVFLDLNGYELTASEDDFEKLVWEVASGKLDKDVVRAFIQQYARKI